MALFLLEQAIGCVYTRICLNALDGEIGPPLSGTEAAKRSGRLSLVGSGVMDGGGREGRAGVPPTSRFTIIKNKIK